MDKISLNVWDLPPNAFPFLPETSEISATTALPLVCCLELLRKSLLKEVLKQHRVKDYHQVAKQF